MARIPLNQSGHRFQFNCEENFSTAIKFEIHYIKPDKTEGIWDALYDLTHIFKDFTEVSAGISELSQIGEWKCWPVVTLADGRRLISNLPFSFTVFRHK
jgi:hypothetical protein